MTTATTQPQYHVRPTRGWLNDPNGIVHHHGRWHVFFQHNPHRPVHETIHWGHVSSPDLVRWTEHPVAFGPTPGGPDRHGCWTGVFLPGLDRPAVVYSGVADDTERSTICLRWGSPDLTDWSEPIVVGDTPESEGVEVMRDPFVFGFAGRRWALLGARLEGAVPAVLLFSCDDPLAWRFEQVWASGTDPVLTDVAPSDVWECPQLVWADGVPVLVLSPQRDRAFGDVVAVVGRIEEVGGRPRFHPDRVDLLDTGNSFYAPQLVQDGTSPLMFGWVREDGDPSGGHESVGCLTLPRRLGVEQGRVRLRVDPAVAGLGQGGGVLLREGEHEVPALARVDVRSLTGSEQAWLRSTGPDPVAVSLAGGATVWVDGDVAEVYPAQPRVPATIRSRDAQWRVSVPEGGSVTVTAVVPPSRG